MFLEVPPKFLLYQSSLSVVSYAYPPFLTHRTLFITINLDLHKFNGYFCAPPLPHKHNGATALKYFMKIAA